MLERIFEGQLALGFAQAGATAVAVLLVALLARTRRIHVEKESVVAMLRGITQIVAVGAVLMALLQQPLWTSAIVLLAMMVAAAFITNRRAEGIPGAFAVSFYGIAIGAGTVIVVMTALGVIENDMTALVPVGSMIIAAGMRANSLALDRIRSEVERNRGIIEAKLALGAAPAATVEPHVQAAVHASLIPQIDTLRSLGVVWIPGIMAGMVLSGADPVYAAVYQFAVIGMIFAAAGLSAVVTTLFLRGRLFTGRAQLAV